MSCDLIIPARAGSKGVPLKNIRELAGKPLIAHVIEAANEASSIDRVFVSTDGNNIADIAREYGAKVVMRPDDISGDVASSESAIFHALGVIEKEHGGMPEYTFFAQCTAPLTLAGDFDCAMEIMSSGNYDSIFAAKEFHGFIWRKDENAQMVGVNHNHKGRRLMRQEMEVEYQETGAFYLFDTKGFIEYKNRFFGRIGVCTLPEVRSIDIDTLEDFVRAEEYLKQEK